MAKYQTLEKQFKSLGGWWVNKPNPRLKEFPLASKTIRFYYRKCNRCANELQYTTVVFALTKMENPYCRLCWHDFKREQKLSVYKEYPRRTGISLDFQVVDSNGCADIYARVSSPSQVDGSGLWRQEKTGIEYCQLNQIRVRNIIQDVCSAWRKDNCVVGNLGFKLRQWEKQQENPPNYLVIEDLDRFSRQEPFTALEHLSRLRDLGTSLVVYNGEEPKIYPSSLNYLLPKGAVDSTVPSMSQSLAVL